MEYEKVRIENIQQEYYSKIKHSYEQNYAVNLEAVYKKEAELFLDSQMEEFVANAKREELLKYTYKSYQALLKKDNNIALAHFHNADGTTLLRLHDLEHYGDKIAQKRKLLQKVHKEHYSLSVFENGEMGLYFRVVVPIFYNKKYVGAFELGVSPKKILDYVARFNELEGFMRLSDKTEESLLVKTRSLDKYKNFLPAKDEKIAKKKLVVDGKRHVALYSFALFGLDSEPIGEFVFFQDMSKYYQAHNEMVENAILLFILMGISLFTLLSYLLYLSARDAASLKGRADLMLNAQENIVIVTKTGDRLQEVNRVFLDFFGFGRLEEFLKEYDCVCDRFIKDEGYLTKEIDGLNWVFYMLSYPKRKHLVKIADKDGLIHSFRLHATPLDKNSFLKEYVVTFEDITQELQIQHTLELERDLFSAGPVVTIEWSPKENWPIRYVSANVTKELGYTQEEMKEESFVYAELIHPDDIERVFYEVQEHIQNRILHYEQSYRLRQKNGEYKWFYDFSTLVFEGAELVSIHGYMFDQSEIKKAQEQLQEQKERLQNIIDGTNVGTWEWNIQTGETLFNEKWAEMIGYTLEEISPTTIETWTNFANAEDLQAAEAQLMQTLSGKREYYEAKCRMKHRNGEEIWIYDRGKVVKWDANGDALVMSGTHTNIDAEVKAQEQLEKLNKNLEKALATKSQFLANMSHEIRTPMNAILGLSELLKDTQLDSKQLDFLEKIHGSSQMLLRIINDILDFSKLEAGKLELESKPFVLEGILSQMRVLFLEQAQKKSLELRCEIEENVPTVIVGDMLRLEQVVSNLMSNALKFTKRGYVALCIKMKERIDNSNAVLQITVKDSGIGISKEEQKRLFLPFSQADSSTTRKFGGTGLGLVISSKILHAMGSEIALESVVGEGSSFSFDLRCGVASWDALNPEELEEQHSLAQRDQASDLSFEGSCVLLIEDNELNIEVAKLMLERVGIEVIVARDGAEGLKSYFTHREKIDLILMDLQMPNMDGYEATQEIRKEDSDITIIALTAAATQEDRERVRNAGMNKHLSKPIEKERLYSLLLEYLSSKESESQPPLSKEFVKDMLEKLQESTILAHHEQERLLLGLKSAFDEQSYLAFVRALEDLELEDAAEILQKNIDLIL